MELDLKQLRRFLAIARARSFSRAAVELNMTQPALTHSIAALEKRIGSKIFERGSHGVGLTDVGAMLLAKAEPIVRDAELLADSIRLHHKGYAGRLTLGVVPMVASVLLGRLGARMVNERPHLQIRSSIKPTTALFGDLLDHKIELLFCIPDLLPPSHDIAIEVIGSIDSGIFVRAGHPLTRIGAVTLDDVRHYPIAAAAEIELLWVNQGNEGFICENFEILRQVVVASDVVWSSSPQMVVDELASGQLVELVNFDAPRRSHAIASATLARRTLSPTVSIVVDCARQLLCEGA